MMFKQIVQIKKLIYLFFIIAISITTKAETRIKDIVSIEGVRENLLVGQGLVVGLNGTGDNLKNSAFTEKSLTDLLERLGINVYGEKNIKTKNIAAVTVTANLPPFSRQGNKIDVKVSALGDAKSLKGGTLLVTPMIGADGNVYAVAQGVISISEFVPTSSEVKNRSNAIETNGYIQNGAIVEAELNFTFSNLKNIKLSLSSPDFNTAVAVAQVINNNIPGNTAKTLDAATIEITIPNYKNNDIMDLIAKIESLSITPDYKAKIVIHESTGTVVISDKVHIRPVAIAQGNLVLNVGHLNFDTQFPPTIDDGQREQINNFVDQKRGKAIHNLKEMATLGELVEGLNKLGVWPRDIIHILHNMKSVGALDAVIEVK